jgi:HlyD family type I secretion membrane fusion protein
MVMGLAITTEGGVISPGGRLMDIVPEDERLVVEAQIQPHLIDKVVPGLQAEVRFSALNLRSTPITMGEVEWVSADKFQNPQDMANPMGYYSARLVVPASEMKKLGADVHIRAGMPADVIFNTGERTFLEYLVKPLTDRMAKSLKEQ